MNTASSPQIVPLTYRSTIELVSILIGAPSTTALLERYGTLTEVARQTEDEISHLANITLGRAKRIKTALLLAQKLSQECPPERPLIDSPDKVADLLREENRAYAVETFQIVMLNPRRRLIRVERLSQGTLDTLLIHPREVFKPAILATAASIVLVHNHPGSGDPTPSEADIKVTRDLIRAGQLLKIEVGDHVIIGRPTTERPKDYASLRELGFFYS